MTTPKPTPTLMEDASLLHSAAMQYGDRWPIGWTADEAWARLRAALERLEELSGNPGELDALRAERDAAINYQNALRGEIHRLQSEVAALTKELEEAEHERFCEEQAAKMAEMARDAAESRCTALAARVEALGMAVEVMLDLNEPYSEHWEEGDGVRCFCVKCRRTRHDASLAACREAMGETP